MFSPDDSDMYSFLSEDKKQLEEGIKILESTPRIGNDVDEPEGERYIQISDTLAKKLSSLLKLGIKNMKTHY